MQSPAPLHVVCTNIRRFILIQPILHLSTSPCRSLTPGTRFPDIPNPGSHQHRASLGCLDTEINRIFISHVYFIEKIFHPDNARCPDPLCQQGPEDRPRRTYHTLTEVALLQSQQPPHAQQQHAQPGSPNAQHQDWPNDFNLRAEAAEQQEIVQQSKTWYPTPSLCCFDYAC